MTEYKIDAKIPTDVCSKASPLKRWLLRASIWSSRTPEDIEQLNGPKTRWFGIALCFMLFLTGIGMFVWTGKDELNRWEKPDPSP